MKKRKIKFKRCLECGTLRPVKGRGLCRVCYDLPAIRALHRQTRVTIRVYALTSKRHPLPEKPTRFLPGTVRKLQVLFDRARRGEQLFHPLDR